MNDTPINSSLVSSMWQSLPHAWTRDARDPLFTFELRNGELWGFYGMNLIAWNELLAMMTLEALLAALLSTFVYKSVVQRQCTTAALLVSYGVVPPLVFLGPFFAFRALGVRNQLFRFCLGAIMPVTCMFKSTAAAHGFTPDYAKLSMRSFALYFACPMMMKRDPKLDKYVPVTSLLDVLGHVPSFLGAVFAMGALQSLFNLFPGVLAPPLAQRLPSDSDYYAVSTLLQPQAWLVRNLFFAIYFQLIITSFGGGLVLFQSLVTGNQTQVTMDNPCLTSRSPSQFWGSKWNLVIHDVLKTGVYLPVRRHFSKHFAMIATFVASGGFHEILLWMFSYPLDDSDGCFSDPVAAATKPDCYRAQLFSTTLFFAWQAGLVALEYSPLGKLSVWSYLPDLVAAILLVVVGCPLAHYFCEPYWNSLCFENAMAMFFLIKPVAAA